MARDLKQPVATPRILHNHKKSHPDQLLPVLSAVGGFVSSSEECSDMEDIEPTVLSIKEAATQSKTTANRQSSRPKSRREAAPSITAPSHRLKDAPTTADTEQVDLTRSDEDEDYTPSQMEDQSGPSAATAVNADRILDNTLLDSDVQPKHLKEAWRQFPDSKPPFARVHRNNYEKTVMLAFEDGQLPDTPVLATLGVRRWGARHSYYTLDRNGERLIVNPIGGRYKHEGRNCNAYRSWSGQGNVFDKAPVAFAFRGDLEEEQSNRKDVEEELESNFGGITIQAAKSLEDQDRTLRTSQGSDRENEDQEPPATGRNDGDTTHSQEEIGYGRGATPLDQFPPLHNSPPESSNAGPKISEVAAGKRPASDTIENDRRPKKFHSVNANTLVHSPTSARVPPNLTLRKRERTILYVLIPGSTPAMVPIKLRSAMSLATFFSSVTAAAGVPDHEYMAIAVIFGGPDGGQHQSLIVRRDMTDSFEVLLEMVDESKCWEEEGGRMALQLELRNLRWRYF